jgi:hypothetical protein
MILKRQKNLARPRGTRAGVRFFDQNFYCLCAWCQCLRNPRFETPLAKTALKSEALDALHWAFLKHIVESQHPNPEANPRDKGRWRCALNWENQQTLNKEYLAGLMQSYFMF